MELLRRRAGDDVLVARSRLGADLTSTFRVASPSRKVTYVARLPRTRAHARARDAVTPAAAHPGRGERRRCRTVCIGRGSR